MLDLATPADLAELGRLHVQAWRETYPGLVPDAVIARLDASERTAIWRGVLARGGRIRLARRDGALVGFGASGAQREPELMPYAGEFYAIYLLRRAQGGGLGRALMAAMAGDLLAQGMAAANLWVLDGNHLASGFYAALGGRVVHQRAFRERGWEGRDTAYAWDDLTHLLPGHVASAGDSAGRRA
jgi:ribosomal protein S18 acetylase RimI-like enzyme